MEGVKCDNFYRCIKKTCRGNVTIFLLAIPLLLVLGNVEGSESDVELQLTAAEDELLEKSNSGAMDLSKGDGERTLDVDLWKIGAFIIMCILVALYAFVALVMVCGEFFVPSLDVIIEKLR